MKTLQIYVSGRVQGVGYRFFAVKNAVRLNITGYAKNLVSGKVKIFASGTAENLNLFIDYLKKGPTMACVNNMEIEEFEYDDSYQDFRIEY